MAFNRDSTLDISLGTGSWRGGASDGTTLWFVNDTPIKRVAYVASTRARDSAKDIALGTGVLARRAFRRHHALVRGSHGRMKRVLTWPRPGREIQPRISRLARDLDWRAFRRHHAMVRG